MPRWFSDMGIPKVLLYPKENCMFGPKTAIFAPKYVNLYVIFTCHHETDNVVPNQEANFGRLGNLGYIFPKDFWANNFPFLYINNMPSSPLIQLSKVTESLRSIWKSRLELSFIFVFVCSQRQRGAGLIELWMVLRRLEFSLEEIDGGPWTL